MTQLKAAATEKKPPRWYMTFLSQFHAYTAFCVVWPSHTLTVGLVTTGVLSPAANAVR